MLDKLAGVAVPHGKAQARRSGLGRITLEVRQGVPPRKRVGFILLTLLFGLVLSAAVLMLNGIDAASIFDEVIVETFFSSRSLGAVLVDACPLVVVGLAAALAFRVRFWNIGLEGQIIFGGIGATLVSLHPVPSTTLLLPAMLIAAAAGGALWITVPLILRHRLGVNEIISTLLLNYVAFDFLMHLLYGPWQDRKDGFPHSPQFTAAERLPMLGWQRLDWSLPIALAVGVAVWWLIRRSRFGVYMRFMHANDRMALAVGVPIVPVGWISVLLSGALAGLTGFLLVAGQEYRLTLTFWEGYGFSGIVLAFLAGNDPLGVGIIGFLMGGLYVASKNIEVFYNVAAGILPLIEALIVMSVSASAFFVRYRVRWARRRGD